MVSDGHQRQGDGHGPHGSHGGVRLALRPLQTEGAALHSLEKVRSSQAKGQLRRRVGGTTPAAAQEAQEGCSPARGSALGSSSSHDTRKIQPAPALSQEAQEGYTTTRCSTVGSRNSRNIRRFRPSEQQTSTQTPLTGLGTSMPPPSSPRIGRTPRSIFDERSSGTSRTNPPHQPPNTFGSFEDRNFALEAEVRSLRERILEFEARVQELTQENLDTKAQNEQIGLCFFLRRTGPDGWLAFAGVKENVIASTPPTIAFFAHVMGM